MRNNEDSELKGVFTPGIVCTGKKEGEQKIALFFTGRNHAGENLTEVLRQRESGLGAPIQMCDALCRGISALSLFNKPFSTSVEVCTLLSSRVKRCIISLTS